MYMVMTGEIQFSGRVAGVWENRDGAEECVQKLIEMDKELEWKRRGDNVWNYGCNWISISKINLNENLL